LVTDNTLLSNTTTQTINITASDVTSYDNLAFYQATASKYYTSNYNGSDKLSIILPDVVGNSGKWFVVEDLGLTININKKTAEYGSLHKTLYAVGSVGIVTKTYFYCDGIKWRIAHSFKPIVVSLSDGITIKETKVTLTVQQIRNLHITPIVLIPTLGVGKAVEILSAFFNMDYNISPYNSVLLRIRSTSSSTFYGQTGGINATSSTNGIFADTGGTANNKQLITNTGIEIYTNGDAGGGGSSIDVYITYREVTITTTTYNNATVTIGD
jgi:hypothetical protein